MPKRKPNRVLVGGGEITQRKKGRGKERGTASPKLKPVSGSWKKADHKKGKFREPPVGKKGEGGKVNCPYSGNFPHILGKSIGPRMWERKNAV